MNSAPRPVRITSLSTLFIILAFSALLAPIIAATYAYDAISVFGSAAGLLLLLAACVFVWVYGRRVSRSGGATLINRAIIVGLALGLLWVAEISINNLLAPPLPARDIIDNVFWAIIASAILTLATVYAYRTDRFRSGVVFGAWSGFVSGTMACCMALSLIVFGMRFVTQDPLNVAEWASLGAGSGAPSMAAYFAFQTFAGAVMHLVVLGIAMGGLLGLVGGGIGQVIRRASRRVQRS